MNNNEKHKLSIVKKIAAALLAICLIVGIGICLVGCNNDDPVDQNQNPGIEQPTNPENPGDPTDPENPGEPTDPENPGEPTDPENPGDPTDPENPGDPTDPTDPEKPPIED